MSYSVHDNVCKLWLIHKGICYSCHVRYSIYPSFKSKVVLCKSLGGLVQFKKFPLENKKVPKIKTLKNAFFIKIIKNVENVFYIYDINI